MRTRHCSYIRKLNVDTRLLKVFIILIINIPFEMNSCIEYGEPEIPWFSQWKIVLSNFVGWVNKVVFGTSFD